MKLPVIRKVALVVSVFTLVSVYLIAPVLAQSSQTGNGFIISPVRHAPTIEKGKTDVLSLTLTNPADVPVTARMTINDFVASDKEDGEPKLILDEKTPLPKNSFKSLVDPLADIQLKAKEKKILSVAIKVPEEANSGGYYGAIRFEPVTPNNSQGNVGLSASLATIVLVRVPGDLIERLDLLELTAGQNGHVKSFISKGDVSVITRLKNEGDIHVKPFGKITVKNIFGKVIYEGEFNSAQTEDSRATILPGSIRKFENNLGKFEFNFKSNKKPLLGRYTIEANLGISQGSGDIVSSRTSFWYLPLWSIIVLLIILAGLVGGGYLIYRRLSSPHNRHGARR